MSSERQPSIGLGKRLLAAAQQDTSWVVRTNGGTERTLTTVEIVDAYNERLLDPETYVWTDGMVKWQQLQAVDAIVEALHADAARDSGDDCGVRQASQPRKRSNGSARHEDSAIFSLAMLVGDGRSKEYDDPRSDDSGLIDLAALTVSTAQPAIDTSAATVLAGGLFPAQATTPIPAAPPVIAPVTRSDRRVIGSLIAAVILLSAVLVFKLLNPRGPTLPAPTASVAPLTSATMAAAEPAAAELAAASDGAATSASAERPNELAASASEAVKTAPSSDKARRAPPPRPSQVTRPQVAAPSAQPPAPAKRRCPCPPEDLTCNMRCATNR